MCVLFTQEVFCFFFTPVAPPVVELPLDWKLLFDSFPLLQADNRLVEAPSPSLPLRGLGTLSYVSAVFESNIVAISSSLF